MMLQRRGLPAALHTAGPVHRPVAPFRTWSGRLTASASADLELLRASALLDADPASAARRASGILVDAPDHAEAKLLLAAACRRLGDPDKALGVLEAVAAAHPESPAMQLELGRAYAAAGRRPDALAAYRRAVGLNSELVEGWRELATELFAAGDVPGGDAAYANYENRVADPPGFVNAVGALADNRLDDAEVLLGERLRQTPRDAVALRLLGAVAMRRGDLAQAERCLNECLEVAPGYAQARYDLACVYFALQRPERVLPLVERLLALDPRHAACRLLKARTLRLVNRADEAIALLELAVTEHPEDADAWLLLGHVRREIGRQAGAIEAYRRTLEHRPDSSEAYWSLANLKTIRLEAADVDAMQRLLARSNLLPVDRARLDFALGKAREDTLSAPLWNTTSGCPFLPSS